jgi:hypothetical protein
MCVRPVAYFQNYFIFPFCQIDCQSFNKLLLTEDSVAGRSPILSKFNIPWKLTAQLLGRVPSTGKTNYTSDAACKQIYQVGFASV